MRYVLFVLLHFFVAFLQKGKTTHFQHQETWELAQLHRLENWI
jgi:hypothetical protein